MLTYAVVQVLEERVRQCVSEAHELRARNEELEVEVDTLTRQHQALQATLQLLTAQVFAAQFTCFASTTVQRAAADRTGLGFTTQFTCFASTTVQKITHVDAGGRAHSSQLLRLLYYSVYLIY